MSETRTKPILRIEAGQHTAVINRLDADPEGRFLVTGSDDKTARVWSLPDEGRLLRVLRPPIGPDDEGKIYAVAISPDGATVAVGGWMSKEGTDEIIYLFDRANGQVKKQLRHGWEVVFDLCFSPDGAYLAAGLSNNGVRVWRTPNWTEAFDDRDYHGGVYGLSFSSDGRLAATCEDGKIRLYDSRFRLIARKGAPHGREPSSIGFSPDGASLAVSYDGTTAVSILSGRDLSPLFAADTQGIDNGDLSSVAWSADGRFLYAGGRYEGKSVFAILRWADGGKGRRITLPAAENTVTDLKSFSAAGVLFAANDPRFAAFDGKAKKVLDRGPGTVDMRDKLGDAFSVSSDGCAVRFGLKQGAEGAVVLDLKKRIVTASPVADRSLASARIDGLEITGWEDTTEPKLEGKKLALDKKETSRSLAIAADGQRFLLGTDWSLRLFSREGKELWRKPVPGTVWGVLMAEGRHLALAACADGTIRWYRLKDGAELLTAFVHPDGRRWVAWTPEGYYDAAAGADGLIGWHVNQGRDEAADFFPVSRFRRRSYRPGVGARVLKPAKAPRQADAGAGRATKAPDIRAILPPGIDLLAPHDRDLFERQEVTLTYLLRLPARAAAAGISVLIDGRPEPVQGRRTVARAAEAEVCQATVRLPPHDTTLALSARTRETTGRSETIHLLWRGKAPEAKPTLYLLAVGVSKYKNYRPLKFAHQDAKDFAEAMLKQKGLLYEEVKARTLVNEEAKRNEIVGSLGWLGREPQSRDVAIVFLSGHGLSDHNRRYYFLPWDFDLAEDFATGVRQSDLKDAFTAIPAKKVLVFVDSCHAGGAGPSGIKGIKGANQADIDGFVNDLKATETGVVVFASSTGSQVSEEREEWHNGAFTEALLEALTGKELFGEKAVTVKALDLFLGRRVKELTAGAQTPTTTMPEATPDFPIAALAK